MDFEKLWAILNKAIGNAKLTGSLDGKEFQDISFLGSGRTAFIVKGWIDPDEGPAVRFRADWSKLNAGEIFYQDHPSDKGWQETAEGDFRIKRQDGSISIAMSFLTKNLVKHEVEFTAEINLPDLFALFLDQ